MPARERPLVEAFYGISSPWAYFGAPSLYNIVERTGARLRLRPILWAEDQDIADLDTLKAIARETLREDAAALIANPQQPAIIAAWDDNLTEAERLGIFRTPSYVVNGELFWGQDRLDFVERALLTTSPTPAPAP